MPKSYRLTLTGKGLEDAEIRGEFSDEEHATLRAFLQQYEDLVQSRPFQERFPCHIEVEASQGELRVSVELPSPDDLAILLHRLRPFILENEPASFARVSGLLKKHGRANPHVLQLLRDRQKLYNGQDMQQQIKIRVNDIILNSESMMREWLNSTEYHRDPDRRRAVEGLLQGLPNDLYRGVMVCLLVEKVKAIQSVASLAALMLGNVSELDFKSKALP